MKLLILTLAATVAVAASEPGMIRVRLGERDGGKIVDLPLEQYVAAVVAGESAVFRSDEALKAMAVTIRTFAVRLKSRHAAQGFDLCGNTHCQVIDLRNVQARFTKAAEATAGELLWFNGKLVFACYSRDCGGRTEDVDSVWPGAGSSYMKGVVDPYCLRAGDTKWQWSTSGERMLAVLRNSGLKTPPVLDRITVVKRTSSGRASLVSLAGRGESVPISASSLRFAMGRELGWNTLRSERWDVHGGDGQFSFLGTGAGHGAGMCQRGADEMGVEGRSYRDILSQYFPDAIVGITARGLKWTRLGGERVAVMTTQVSRDGAVVGIADSMTRELGLPAGIEIRIYPDVDSFRNTTSEPGWVAAHTVGHRIHMQPLVAPLMERTLRHELLHVMIEDRTTRPLPIWFREGLVACLENRSGRGGGDRAPNDADIRQTADAAKARQGYDDARKRVAALIARYGESTVLDWLTRGLPAEVAKGPAQRQSN